MSRAEHSREWRKNNAEKIREYRRRWHKENAAKEREYKRKWRAENIERKREYQREWKRRTQEGLAGRPKPYFCELCGADVQLVFDHCHESGAFRGWICHGCNKTLGHARDNAALLRRMADYIERNRYA